MEKTRMEILENDEWIPIEFSDLKDNNVFRMLEPDGTIKKIGAYDTAIFKVKKEYNGDITVSIEPPDWDWKKTKEI